MDLLASLIYIQPPPLNVVFPYYHLVADETPKHVSALYTAKTVEEFRQDLDLLLEYFEPVEIKELYELQKTNSVRKKPGFHLSFDDGLREVYTTIAPILQDKKIPATFFVNPAFVDNKDLMFRYKQSLIVNAMIDQDKESVLGYDREEILTHGLFTNQILEKLAKELNLDFQDYLQEKKPYLNSKELKVLQKQGFTIGSHSLTHLEYSRISEKHQLVETMESIDWVRNNYEEPYKVFAFPFSDYGVKKSYFDTLEGKIGLCFTTAGIKNDVYPWVLNRFSMEEGKNPLANQIVKWTIKNTIGIRHKNIHSY